MQKLRNILLFLNRGYSERAIAKQTGVSRPTIHLYSELFKATGKDYSTLLALKDHELNSIIVSKKEQNEEPVDLRKFQFQQQVGYFASELKRVGVTRYLLWQEHLKLYPDGVQYSRFCELLDKELSSRKASMHFEHEPAVLLEIDFAGSKLAYVKRETGEVTECPVLVGVLPFSGYCYLEALPDASLPNVIQCLNKMLAYFQGAPLNVISDNMKQWVTRTCKYEPTFPVLLEQWSLHNKVGLLATRPGRPKDKPSVENQVLISYRRIYAMLRNDIFHSLDELNRGILEKIKEHHELNFQKKSFSRKDLFESEEQHLLQKLPESAFEIRHTTKAKVQKNYHVVVGEDWHYYSVPHSYLGKEATIVYNTSHVEIYIKLERIAIHSRSYKKHGYSTNIDHMPENHRKIAESRGWDPDYYLQKAKENGPCTHQFVSKLMESKVSIHQAYSPCQGILRLIRTYGAERVEAACKRALLGYRYNHGVLYNILTNNMDKLQEEPVSDVSPIPSHNNLRGPEGFSGLN
ncbi:Mobile element protein [Sphingobacterium sp. JB170]|nr:Mobile element protein [Sphingobacterium sp. JB170]